MVLAADRFGRYFQLLDSVDSNVIEMDVEAGSDLFHGALVGVIPGAGGLDELSDTAAMIFYGINIGGRANNTAGADGAIKAEIYTGRFIARLLKSAGTFTIVDLGTAVFAVDDNSIDIAATTTNDVPVGRLFSVENTTDYWVLCTPQS